MSSDGGIPQGVTDCLRRHRAAQFLAGNSRMTNQKHGRQKLVATRPPGTPVWRRRASRSRPAGYSLIEILVAMVVSATLLSMGIPRFQQSLEQSRANVAGANLRAIWSAQRLYWLENRTYAPDLATLLSANLIDPSVTTATAPYGYLVATASDSWFTATATRAGSACWAGTLTIAADGSFSGSVQQGNGAITIVPGFQ
jgi:prepilin-type N-terminal cleavage/methylation domain-containing protein